MTGELPIAVCLGLNRPNVADALRQAVMLKAKIVEGVRGPLRPQVLDADGAGGVIG